MTMNNNVLKKKVDLPPAEAKYYILLACIGWYQIFSCNKLYFYYSDIFSYNIHHTFRRATTLANNSCVPFLQVSQQ